MFVSRQPKQVTRASSTSQDKAQLRTKTKPSRDKVFELDTYLDRRDFAGALTLLRLLRRPGNDGQELGPKKTAGTLEGDELYSWRLNTCCFEGRRDCNGPQELETKPSRSALCNRLLFLLAHQRQHSEQTLLDRYQQLSRESVEDQLALASTSFVHNNFQEAAEIYKRLLSEGNKGGQEGGSALHVYLALCYFKLGYDDVALELLAVYLIGHPDSFFATNLKASCNFRLYSAPQPGHIRVSNSESNGIEKHGAATERVLTPLVGHLEEAQLNLVLLHLKRREYHKAFALMEDLEPRTATERALKGVLHAVIGEQTHSKEHIFLAEKCFHAAGSSADDSDTIPGRQCMASYFMLRKEFSDVNVYLSSIATYLSTDDAFNWNYGLSLAATGAYREAEEILARVQSPELRSQLVLCGWLSRCYINNGRAAQAWELYLKVENSQTAFVLLKQIANDCYKAQQFFYAAKAFDVLERLDPDPEYWEGKRGACLGFFRQVATGHENESGATLAHRCDEALKLLGNSKNVLEATKLVTVIRKWTGTFL
ncbi:Intraflagellar transport protein 56 [Phytophthora ramorum]|uniref:Intraflagellar transport protein 56 n=1 Tax=Phytophthora ramorum TaxID=164328 RepID=UPI0030B5E35A|nr:Intraflagellar transport protein 56 [Phytophthora ramorum]